MRGRVSGVSRLDVVARYKGAARRVGGQLGERQVLDVLQQLHLHHTAAPSDAEVRSRAREPAHAAIRRAAAAARLNESRLPSAKDRLPRPPAGAHAAQVDAGMDTKVDALLRSPPVGRACKREEPVERATVRVRAAYGRGRGGGCKERAPKGREPAAAAACLAPLEKMWRSRPRIGSGARGESASAADITGRSIRPQKT